MTEAVMQEQLLQAQVATDNAPGMILGVSDCIDLLVLRLNNMFQRLLVFFLYVIQCHSVTVTTLYNNDDEDISQFHILPTPDRRLVRCLVSRNRRTFLANRRTIRVRLPS